MPSNLKFCFYAILFSLYLDPTQELNNAGTKITDLEQKSFLSDITRWSNPGLDDYTTVCAGSMIYGHKLAPGQNISRTYSNLPPHQSVTVIVNASVLDSWDKYDYLGISVDQRLYQSLFRVWVATVTCGSTLYPVAGLFTYIIKRNHTSDKLTLAFIAGQDQHYTDESFGISSVIIMLANNSVTESYTYSSPNIAFQAYKVAMPSIQYTSVGCHPTCGTCKGPLATDCLTCANISMYYNGSSCFNCMSECLVCVNDTACLPYTDCTSLCLNCSTINECVECQSPAILLNGQCICPFGSFLNGSEQCQSFLNFSLSYDFEVDASGIVVKGSISQEEAQIFPDRNYTWDIISDKNSTLNLQNLQDYIHNQTDFTILLEYIYLEPNTSYTVTCTYLNFFNETRTNSTIISNLSFLLPVFDPAKPIVVQRFVPASISSKFLHQRIPILSNSYQYSWEVSMGNITGYTGLLTSFDIPQCKLSPNKSYELETRVWFTPIPYYDMIQKIPFSTSPDLIYLEVNYLNRQHPFTQPIVLKVNLYFEGDCPDMSKNGFKFTWTCLRSLNRVSYTPCLDSSFKFNVSTEDDFIVIPTSYFYKGLFLKLSVVAERNESRLISSGTLDILGEKTIIIAITCLEPPCERYNPDADLYLKIVVQNNPGIDIQFQWNLNLSIATVTYNNLILVKANDGTAVKKNNFAISANVINLGYNGGSKYEVPVNFSPKNGTLKVTPAEGIALQTQFEIETSGWIDTDLPLTYEFFYQTFETSISLSSETYSDKVYSLLPGAFPVLNVVVSVNVKDMFDAMTLSTFDVTVANEKQNMTQVLSSISTILESLNPIANPVSSMANAALVTSQAALVESAILELRKRLVSCTNCSSEDTECFYGICTCLDDSNKTVDCSLSEKEFNDLVNAKNKVMDVLRTSFENLNSSGILSNSTVNSMLSTLKVLSTNTDFLLDSSIIQIQNILDNSIKFTDNKTNFTLFQHTEAVELVNHLIDYKATKDCNCTSSTCQALENRTKEYMQKLADRSLQNVIPGQEAYDYLSIYFDITTVRTTMCDLSNLTLQTSSETPAVSFQPRDASPLNCTKLVDVQMFTFKNNTFGCTDIGFKNTLMISIRDTETGKSLDDLFKANVKMPNGLPCPKGCKDLTSYCDCDLSLFDVTKQLDKIFRTSSLRDLENFGALASWVWYSSPIFWVNFGMLGWLLISFILFKKSPKVANYCIIDQINAKQSITKSVGLVAIFLVSSNITSIFMLNKSSLSKSYKMLLYYIRLLLYATYSAIFSSSGSTDLLAGLQFYIILLPLLTVVPINSIVSKIVSSRQKNEVKKPRLDFMIQFRQIITFGIMSGCIIAMFIIAANKDASAQKPWLATFLISLLQELIILPIGVVIFEIVLLKRKQVYLLNGKKSIIKEKIFGLIDPNSIIIYDKIEKSKKLFSKKITPTNIESLRRSSQANISVGVISEANLEPISPVALLQSKSGLQKIPSKFSINDLKRINVNRRIPKSHIFTEAELK